MEQLLKETEAYLTKLGVKLREQKELAKMESDNLETTVRLEDESVAAGKDQTLVRKLDLMHVDWQDIMMSCSLHEAKRALIDVGWFPGMVAALSGE